MKWIVFLLFAMLFIPRTRRVEMSDEIKQMYLRVYAETPNE